MRAALAELGATLLAGVYPDRPIVPQSPQEFKLETPQKRKGLLGTRARRAGVALTQTLLLATGVQVVAAPAYAIEVPIGITCAPVGQAPEVGRINNEEKAGLAVDFSIRPNGTVSEVAQIGFRDEALFHVISTQMTHLGTTSLLPGVEATVIADTVDPAGAEHNQTQLVLGSGKKFDVFVDEVPNGSNGNTGVFDMRCVRTNP